jgi:hypothetical protein
VDLGIEGRRVAIEAIATLVHIKGTMVELLLKPAGVPRAIYGPLLDQRDPNTGYALSKRQMAPLILDGVDRRPDCSGVIRRLVEIAAGWTSFHLADDEFAARAAVQKAREVLGMMETMEAREVEAREQARMEEVARMSRERADLVGRHSALLLAEFDALAAGTDHQARGYALQDVLARTFDLHEMTVTKAFTRNAGGEQIDGAFKLDGWHYIAESRWRAKVADVRDLDGLLGQVQRSGKQTMGLFLSIEGWSDNVPGLLKQNPEKSILLMEGYGLRAVLQRQVDLRDYVLAMGTHLNIRGEPYLSVSDYLAALRRRRQA